MNEGLSLLITYITEYKQYKEEKFLLDVIYACKEQRSYDWKDKLIPEKVLTEYATWKNAYSKNDNKDIINATLNARIKKQNKIIKSKKTKLYHMMQIFLIYTLPVALVKREYNVELNVLEELLLMELIPKTYTHDAWETTEDLMTKYLTNITYRCCRRCGKKRILQQFSCFKCYQVFYCSGKCIKEDIQDKAFGHIYVECDILKK